MKKKKTVTAKTRLSFCAHTHQCNAVNRSIFRFSDQFTCVANTVIAKTQLSFCASTCLHDAANRSVFRFIRSIYMHRNHIHCEDTTQSLLIYTERQQRLCACAATHIHHTHTHCEGMIQLLHIYTLAWCSKSIDFSIFWSIYMRRKYID